eukprot:COSAG01_NODE_360_length_18184_cov_21.881780_14_plen_80_part_00
MESLLSAPAEASSSSECPGGDAVCHICLESLDDPNPFANNQQAGAHVDAARGSQEGHPGAEESQAHLARLSMRGRVSDF